VYVPQGCGGGKRYNMLGIDTSKDTLCVALRDVTTKQVLWSRDVPNTQDGVNSLLAGTPPEASWIIEPTGRYSLLAALMGQEAGRTVLMAPTRKARSFLESVQSRAKTDPVDAKGLALFGLSAEKLASYPVRSEIIDTLDQLLRARKGLVLARSSLTQRQRD